MSAKNSSSVFSLILCFVLSACAHTDRVNTPTQNPPLIPKDAKVEITYVLGHTLHQLGVEKQGNQVTARSLINKEQLQHRQIDPKEYEQFLTLVEKFIGRSLASDETAAANQPNERCSAPYSVTLHQGDEMRKRKGCRSNPEGPQLSRLIHEGEVLLYSKKQ